MKSRVEFKSKVVCSIIFLLGKTPSWLKKCTLIFCDIIIKSNASQKYIKSRFDICHSGATCHDQGQKIT